jgi:type IV secretory pathway TrbL component
MFGESILGLGMGLGVFILSLILVIIIGALILFAATKILKFQKQDFKTAIVVTGICVVATFILTTILDFIPLIGSLISFFD